MADNFGGLGAAGYDDLNRRYQAGDAAAAAQLKAIDDAYTEQMRTPPPAAAPSAPTYSAGYSGPSYVPGVPNYGASNPAPGSTGASYAPGGGAGGAASGSPGGAPAVGAPNAASFAPSGNAKYDSWLTALQGYHAPSATEMKSYEQIHGKGYTPGDLIGKMLNETGGRDVLSPFYQQMMIDQAGGAQAGYNLTSAINTAKGTAASNPSFGEYLKSNFLTGAGSGDPSVVSRVGASPYGSQESGVGQIAQMLQSIRAGRPTGANGATSTGAWDLAPEQSRAFSQFFSAPENQQMLMSILNQGVENNPFASYIQKRQREEMGRAEASGPTGAVDWMTALDNAARVGGIPYR